MKKTLALLLAFVMVISMFAGCNTEKPVETKPQETQGGNKPEETKPQETEPAEPVVLTCLISGYEGIDYDRQLFFGRCVYQTPEADTLVFFKSKKPVEVGRFYKVKITKVKGDDLEGEIVYED